MLKNLRITNEGKSKPLVHLIIEHMSDSITFKLLKACLELGFNSNIHNEVNETAFHLNFKT